MTTLFDAADLASAPGGRSVSDDVVAEAEKVVWGWLKGPLGLTDRPDTIDDALFAAALELALMWLDQRTGTTSRTRGPFTEGFDTKRWQTILDEVRDNATAEGGQSMAGPQGNFPPTQCWPDPILVAPLARRPFGFAPGCWP